MTPTQLRAYSAVVRHSSVKDAAAEIGVTEAAVSLHLGQLDIPEERERIYQSHAVLGRDPASWRPSPRLKLWLVTAGVPIYLTIAGAMYAEGRFITPTHSLADIHREPTPHLICEVT